MGAGWAVSRCGAWRRALTLGACAWWAAPAMASAPLVVHAVVLADPQDGPSGDQAAGQLAAMLTGSGRYRVMDAELLEGRLGAARATVFGRCGLEVACWREVGLGVGVDQVVLVERVDVARVGVRVVDVLVAGPARLAVVGGDGGQDAFQDLFFAPGALRIRGVPSEGTVTLDGTRPVDASTWIELDPLAAGKHAVEVRADGHADLFLAVMVYPGQLTEVTATPPAIATRRRGVRWSVPAAAALAVVGIGAVAAASGAGGVAVMP